MNRKQLEIQLAYAERDRSVSAGRLAVTPEDQLLALSAGGKILPVTGVERPEWLGDEKRIQPLVGGETYRVCIGSERVCLITEEGSEKIIVADTAVLANRCRPAAEQQAA